MSINFEADLLDVTARQLYLRSLARPGQPSLARQQAGRLLVRFGSWLEGRRPDDRRHAPVGPVPRLAGGHR
jgi:hypothetical protein